MAKATVKEKLLLHHRLFNDFLNEKSVAIIGPASSVMLEKNGKFIDSHDIVIRINKGMELVPSCSEYIGKRTDVLYNSLDFDPLVGGNLNSTELEEVEFICCPYSIKQRTFKDYIFVGGPDSIFIKHKIRFIDDELYYDTIDKTNSALNSGFGAILDILNFPISSVYISGIDFYRSVYQDNYNKSRKWGRDYKKIEEDLKFKIFNDKSRHHPDRQYKYFKEIISQDSERIRLDNFMSKIIDDERYDIWDTIPR